MAAHPHRSSRARERSGIHPARGRGRRRLRHRVRRRQRLPRAARRPHRLDLDTDRRPDRRAVSRRSAPAACHPGGEPLADHRLRQPPPSPPAPSSRSRPSSCGASLLPLWQVATLAFLGGVLGISAMIPLRRLLIVRSADELPYPEGTACAQVLRATAADAGGGALDLPRARRRRGREARAGAVDADALGAVPPRARPAQGGAGAGDRARAPGRRLHPRIPAVRDHGVGQPHLGAGSRP